MKIEILGSGCTTCKTLFEKTDQLVRELGLSAQVDYIPNIDILIERGYMQSPVLVIDGEMVISGRSPSVDEIRSEIQKRIK